MWLDGLYMGAPVYALWQSGIWATDATTSRAGQIQLINLRYHKYTYNADKQLNYYGMVGQAPNDSNSFWANKTELYLPAVKSFGDVVWAGICSTGWRVEVMLKEHPDYAVIGSNFKPGSKGLKMADKQSGIYQLLQYDSTMHGEGDIVNDKTYNVCTAPNYPRSFLFFHLTMLFLKACVSDC